MRLKWIWILAVVLLALVPVAASEGVTSKENLSEVCSLVDGIRVCEQKEGDEERKAHAKVEPNVAAAEAQRKEEELRKKHEPEARRRVEQMRKEEQARKAKEEEDARQKEEAEKRAAAVAAAEAEAAAKEEEAIRAREEEQARLCVCIYRKRNIDIDIAI